MVDPPPIHYCVDPLPSASCSSLSGEGFSAWQPSASASEIAGSPGGRITSILRGRRRSWPPLSFLPFGPLPPRCRRPGQDRFPDPAHRRLLVRERLDGCNAGNAVPDLDQPVRRPLGNQAGQFLLAAEALPLAGGGWASRLGVDFCVRTKRESISH